MWERKSLNNERLWKLQHVASKLNKKIKIMKADLQSVQVNLVKKLGDDFEKSDRIIAKKMEELRKSIAKNDENFSNEKERVNRNINVMKKEIGNIVGSVKENSMKAEQSLEAMANKSMMELRRL